MFSTATKELVFGDATPHMLPQNLPWPSVDYATNHTILSNFSKVL